MVSFHWKGYKQMSFELKLSNIVYKIQGDLFNIEGFQIRK